MKPASIYFVTFCTWERLELTPNARRVVMDACLFFDKQRYKTFAGIVMPDHVHLLLQPLPKENAQPLVENVGKMPVENVGKMPVENVGKMPTLDKMIVEPTIEFWSLSSIFHSIKSYSSKQIPDVMKHIGKVWQDGRYDRIVQNERDLYATWEYIRQNPVKARLSKTPEEYPFFWQSSQ